MADLRIDGHISVCNLSEKRRFRREQRGFHHKGRTTTQVGPTMGDAKEIVKKVFVAIPAHYSLSIVRAVAIVFLCPRDDRSTFDRRW